MVTTVIKISLCIFLLAACTRSDSWVADQIHSEKKDFCSRKLTFCAQDPVRGIDLELRETNEHLQGYLLVHSLPVAALRNDPKKVRVDYQIQGIKCQAFAYRMKGGQRLLLTDEMTDTVIQALLKNEEVTFFLPGYETRVHAEGFVKRFRNFVCSGAT